MMRLDKKRGQLSLANAPMIVFIVGFVFILMATVAFVGSEYKDAMVQTGFSESVINETVTTTERSNGAVLNAGDGRACGATQFSLGEVCNTGNCSVAMTEGTDYLVNSKTGAFTNITALNVYNEWEVSYSYIRGDTSCNVTEDLLKELSNNTSIAGIVLTISLIGIVLSVLVGVFVVSRRNGI